MAVKVGERLNELAVTPQPQFSNLFDFGDIPDSNMREWDFLAMVTTANLGTYAPMVHYTAFVQLAAMNIHRLWTSEPAVIAPDVDNQPIILLEHSKLAAPVVVRTDPAPNGDVLLIDVVTGIWAVATSAAEAIEAFIAALQEHEDVLAAEPSLSPGLQYQLRYLQSHLAP